MKWLKRALLILVLLLVALAALDFMLENRQVVTLQFLDLQAPALPLSIYIILAFILGGLLGVFLGWVITARLR